MMIRLGTTGTVLEGAILVMEILGVRSLTAHPRVVCVVKGMWGAFPNGQDFLFNPFLSRFSSSSSRAMEVDYL